MKTDFDRQIFILSFPKALRSHYILISHGILGPVIPKYKLFDFCGSLNSFLRLVTIDSRCGLVIARVRVPGQTSKRNTKNISGGK